MFAPHIDSFGPHIGRQKLDADGSTWPEFIGLIAGLRVRRRKPFQLARGAMAGELQILMPDSRRTAGLSSDSAAFKQDHFLRACLRGLDLLFLLCSNFRMTDRPASWRVPTPKQMEKLAAEAIRGPEAPAEAPDAPLPAEYWDSVLKDLRAQADGAQMRQRRLSEIRRHVLRISCRRCERTVEIQTADAVRLYGGNAVWKDVAQRLLDNTCQQRTGRHEEDGCWPGFDMT